MERIVLDNAILCLIAGLLAGVVRVVYGWLESDEKFDPKLFAIALIRTVIMGAMMGYGLNQTPLDVFFIVYTADTLITKTMPLTKGGHNKDASTQPTQPST